MAERGLFLQDIEETHTFEGAREHAILESSACYNHYAEQHLYVTFHDMPCVQYDYCFLSWGGKGRAITILNVLPRCWCSHRVQAPKNTRYDLTVDHVPQCI
jgi:hypothetical protein